MNKVPEDVVISVKDISKYFEPNSGQRTIKQAVTSLFRRDGESRKKGSWALKNIDFEIKKGEFFGIVGRNGSGKSTLLKLIAGVYTPTSGAIKVNGKLVPFIELGVGFNPELSGRDNVFLNGALLGFDRKDMEAMYDEIVDFAELQAHMGKKLKNFSSGMQVRLAFSIAIRAKADILLIDEVLAVGDEAFQRKCYEYFDDLKTGGVTVILVTHDMSSVERFCTRALLLEYGDLKLVSTPQDVARQYTLDNMKEKDRGEKKSNSSDNPRRELSKEIKALDIKLISKRALRQDDSLVFEVSYELCEKIEVDLGISIAYQGRSIIEHNTKELDLNYEVGKKHHLRYRYPLTLLNPGVYSVAVAIFEKSKSKLIGYNTDSCSFIVEGKKSGGLLSKRGEWVRTNG